MFIIHFLMIVCIEVILIALVFHEEDFLYVGQRLLAGPDLFVGFWGGWGGGGVEDDLEILELDVDLDLSGGEEVSPNPSHLPLLAFQTHGRNPIPNLHLTPQMHINMPITNFPIHNTI